MKTIFWNSAERRLRAGWRITFQLIFFWIILFGINALAGIVYTRLTGRSTDTPDLYASPWLAFGNSAASMLAVCGSMWLAALLFDRRPFSDYGFHFSKNWWKDFGAGLVLGALVMALIFMVEYLAGWVSLQGFFVSNLRGFSFPAAMVYYLGIYILVGFSEEMISRGYQTRNLAEGLPKNALFRSGNVIIAWVITSAVFGLMHFFNANASWTSTLMIFFAGLMLGLGYILTGSLAVPIGIHIAWNFFQGAVFGFPVSGNVSDASFIIIEQKGPDLLTGGAFGPEAGLVGFAAILLLAGLVYAWVRLSRRKKAGQLVDPLSYIHR